MSAQREMTPEDQLDAEGLDQFKVIHAWFTAWSHKKLALLSGVEAMAFELLRDAMCDVLDRLSDFCLRRRQ